MSTHNNLGAMSTPTIEKKHKRDRIRTYRLSEVAGPPREAFRVISQKLPRSVSRMKNNELTDWLTENILRPLKHQGVELDAHGNIGGAGPFRIPPYKPRVDATFNFNLSQLRRALRVLPLTFKPTTKSRNSFGLKHDLEQKCSISNGECILAVLMTGGAAKFDGRINAELYPVAL